MSTHKRQLSENQALRELVAGFPRKPGQLNALLEGDAELVRIDTQTVLAITTDTIVEEIESGLYADPFLIGWMTITSNLSDLAAVGADPLGILLIQHLPLNLGSSFLQRLQEGISKACRNSHVYVLGGDTNQSSSLQMGAAAIGLIQDEKIILRKGYKPGDRLFISGLMGKGGAFAFARFFTEQAPHSIPFCPEPRLEEGKLIRRYGSSCIDTSDGFFPAICNLIEINNHGIELHQNLDLIVDKRSMVFAKTVNIPPWFLLAGPHGEFELVFTIPDKETEQFVQAANAMNWYPQCIGRIIEDPVFKYCKEQKLKQLDVFRIADLYLTGGGNPEAYLA
ncbi:MAG: AIR synthase related protein, partial [Saprospiraceae bacterium]|nr:AIR synthase related protein [Saprospiraceae bacterium]